MVGLQWKIHLQMDDMGYPYFQETTNVLWGCVGGWVSSVASAVDDHLAGIQNCKSLGAGARRLSRWSLLEASVWRSRSFPPQHRKGGAASCDFCTSFLRLSYKSKSKDLRKTILREPNKKNKARKPNQNPTQTNQNPTQSHAQDVKVSLVDSYGLGW